MSKWKKVVKSLFETFMGIQEDLNTSHRMRYGKDDVIIEKKRGGGSAVHKENSQGTTRPSDMRGNWTFMSEERELVGNSHPPIRNEKKQLP